MENNVPLVDSLADVYPDGTTSENLPAELKSRWTCLLSLFSKIYEDEPDFVARSPGRVNVIGEHIDYSLYDVLPMAVKVDVLVAVKTTSAVEKSTVRLANVKREKFPSQRFEICRDEDVEIDASKHEWANYFKAGLRGALQYLRKHLDGSWTPSGMDIVVDGDVPAGGGMSSSAALVCASSLAAMMANNHKSVSKQDLLELAVVSERAVGVFSGGMDQAASIFSKRDYLLDCSFFPSFSAEHVPVPRSELEATFLVAQSFVAADKHVTAPRQYNLRVVECTLAAVVLAKLHDIQLQQDSSPLGYSLRNLQEEIVRKRGWKSKTPEEQVAAMLSIVEDNLEKAAGYTREDLGQILGLTVTNLESTYMSKFPVQADRFHLRRRAVHVVSEARRVLNFKKILSQAQLSGADLQEKGLRSLGNLMNETQDSCSKLYDCSAPELDEICAIARKAGTYGSRLTGAGWGGCTVHLLPRNKSESVMKALREEYYWKRFPNMAAEEFKQAMVISKPGAGSMVVTGAALKMR